MKANLILCLLAMSAVFTATPALRGSHAAVSHAHPKFSTVNTTFVLDDGAKVEWVAEKDPNNNTTDSNSYTVTITQRRPGLVTYSLLTLGAQAIGHTITIKSASVSTGTVKFALPTEGDISCDRAAPLDVPEARKQGATSVTLDVDRIGFIEFSARVCTMTVVAKNRVLVGTTLWEDASNAPASSAVGHDNTPPPALPN